MSAPATATMLEDPSPSTAVSSVYNNIDTKEQPSLPPPEDDNSAQRNSTTVSEDDPSPRDFGMVRWLLLCVAAYTTSFLYGLDNTIVANIQGAVVVTFNEVEKLSWLGSGFPLGGVATILAHGKLYGTFAFKPIYLGNILLFGIGSVVCGAAPNMNALVIGRVLAGIGAAGMYLGTLSLLSMYTTLKERVVYMGIVIPAWGSGTILGPVIGGAFADSSATWRWAFYINLIIMGAISPVYLLCVPNPQPQPNKGFLRKITSLDWVGILLTCGMYTTWVIALQFGGSTWPWSDGRTIACFVVTGVLIILFGIQQFFCIFTTPEARLFPIAFLRRRTLMLLYMVASTINAALFIVVFYIPIYFQFAHGDDGLHSAVRLLPFVCTLVVSTLINSFTMPIFPYYLAWYLFSGALITAGGAMLYTISSATSSSFIYGATALVGIGTGLCNTAYTVAAAKSRPEEVNDSLSFMNIAQIGGIMHSLALSGTVYQNVAANGLRSVFAAAGLTFSQSEINSAVAGSKSSIFETLTPEVRALAIDSIVNAISKDWIMLIVAGSFTIVCSVVMRWEKLVLKIQAGG
ncbi:major facilitator superfamily domain-containing protein [Xylogone sp. PMI_703]|nr:major facilitator superfamily domain-containing protein [Xylogone sp. PMI_703]